jgi:hypothetical protein
MAGASEEVVARLDLVEREKLVTELRVLAEQADRVQKGSELVALAKAVRGFVIDTPALSTRFRITTRRTATLEDLDTIFSESQAQEQAAQIYNSVVKLEQEILQELQKLPTNQRSDDARW